MSETAVKKSDKKNIFSSVRDYCKEQEMLIRDLFDSFALIVLSLYPFRNIHNGLDLWDTGYNYSNFEYMGMTSMDPMWLFSTYLSNAIGHLMTLLPYGHTLRGLNFYTSFVPALMAVGMYLFFTRHLKFPGWIVFIAEYAALSLCWAPTAVLYQYLTYFVITFSCFLLYRGIVEEEPLTIALSGGLCGLGVFVRFSNLPHASLILAIWMYGFFEFREAFIKSEGMKHPSRVEIMKKTVLRSMCFFLGYVLAFLVFFIYLAIRYGAPQYISAITELFAIPQTASGYSAVGMILNVMTAYIAQIYWVSRLLIFGIGGGAVYTLAVWLDERIGKPEFKKLGSEKTVSLLVILTRVLGVILAVDAILFLLIREHPFVTFNYRSYWCVFALAGTMCFMALILNCIPVLRQRMSAGERLLAVLAVYSLLISSLGGNNGIYYSFNNMFFWLPLTLKAIYDLVVKNKNTWLYGIKCVMVAVVLFFCVQQFMFGMNFAFAEAEKGAAAPRDYIVEYNETLHGIRMSYEKAYSLERLSLLMQENGLGDRELIVMGNVPTLNYCLQMDPAFNPWPDLPSYRSDKMSAKLDEISAKTPESADASEVGMYYEKPVIILCIDENAETFKSQDPEGFEKKWSLIYDFIEKEGYELVYSDDMFNVYE
ncbi:MAG: hypothetical protein ILP17_11085 [Lachnospiraceae bacterium]|nr:hypothetical protein [Lachnospiraceae bacterium]